MRDGIIQVVCAIVAAALLLTAVGQLDYINAQRKDMNLVVNEPLENAPPSLAFATVAMGAFRGLVVDVLWLRAERLKEQGQYFDAKQIAEWITILQPRFASVWEFHAWNMAYNISVAIPPTAPDQRWQWIKNGFELLRDKGIPLNPKSIVLYRQLGLIFQHKIGGVTDDVHKYYKLQLATAMEPLLCSADNDMYADNRYFDVLAEAPSRWDLIVNDLNVTGLVSALKAADEVFDDDKKFVSNYLSLRQAPARFAPAAFEVIDSFRGTEALKTFDIFAKALQLRNVWKLDPVLMRQMNQTYGPVDFSDPNTHLPLDWRHPDVHAIYWAVKGLQAAGREALSADETNTDRIVGHSLQNMFYNGKIFIHKTPVQFAEGSRMKTVHTTGQQATQVGDVFLRPDLRMFDTCNNGRLAVLEKYKHGKHGTYVSMQHGHRNFLRSALLLFYQAGHVRQAQKIHKQMQQLYARDENDQLRPQMKLSLVDYARWVLERQLKDLGYSEARKIVQMLLRESYFRYAVRDDDEAFGREKMAEGVYKHYRAKYSDENRIDLPDMRLLRYTALLDFLNDEQYPFDLRLSLRARIRVERPELAGQLEAQERRMLDASQQSP